MVFVFLIFEVNGGLVLIGCVLSSMVVCGEEVMLMFSGENLDCLFLVDLGFCI